MTTTTPATPTRRAIEIGRAHDDVMALWLACDDDDVARHLHAAHAALTAAASAARRAAQWALTAPEPGCEQCEAAGGACVECYADRLADA